ncbi:hypothetical protein ABNQ39_07215 [Azospirillum sp. A26]|uniref:hypothetical protein n=1 Tax=Azospirillum sp. A26 TaxID=3160607 RepID=UPI0036723AEF
MGDHILRPMGAATLKIATDTQPGRLTVAVECDAGHCHGIDSVTEDVAGTLALEASNQHFKNPVTAWVWAAGRIGDLTPA